MLSKDLYSDTSVTARVVRESRAGLAARADAFLDKIFKGRKFVIVDLTKTPITKAMDFVTAYNTMEQMANSMCTSGLSLEEVKPTLLKKLSNKVRRSG